MKMLNESRTYFRPNRHCMPYLHLLPLKTTEKHSFLCFFGQTFFPFTIFCPFSMMPHPCLPCLEYALATWKITEAECFLNAPLGSLYVQKCHQSFGRFILYLGFYRYSFTSFLWSDITFRKLIFVEIKLRESWPISRKLVPTKTIRKLLIREI